MWFRKATTPAEERSGMPPLCTNCLHAEAQGAPKCLNPRAPSGKTSPVNGSFEFPYCAVERMDWPKNACGPSGRFFQPKPPVTA